MKLFYTFLAPFVLAFQSCQSDDFSNSSDSKLINNIGQYLATHIPRQFYDVLVLSPASSKARDISMGSLVGCVSVDKSMQIAPRYRAEQ